MTETHSQHDETTGDMVPEAFGVTAAATQEGPAPSRRSGVGRSSVLGFLERYALVVLTIAVAIYFSLAPASSEAFPTIDNANVILGGQAVIALLAVGALLSLVTGYFDFSLGAVAAFSQVLCAGLMSRSHWPLWAAILCAVLLSGLVGSINGWLITKIRMNPFVTTLGSGLLLTGIAEWYTNGSQITDGIAPALLEFGSSKLLGLPVVVYVTLVVAVIVWYLLTQTPVGRSLYAIGSNASSARLVGISVDRNVWACFIAGSSIAGVAGVLQLSRVGSASASSGTELLFPALAAVFLGATTVTPGFFNVVGTIVGALFVGISVSGLALSGAAGWASDVFNGAALLIAVGLSTYLGRVKQSGGSAKSG